MDYKIISGVWHNAEHTEAVLQITDGASERPYYFSCVKGAEGETNALLWKMLQRDGSMMDEADFVKMKTGKMKVPEGFHLGEFGIISDKDEKQEVIDTVKTQLDLLYRGSVMAKAERDPLYAEKRKGVIDRLVLFLNEMESEED